MLKVLYQLLFIILCINFSSCNSNKILTNLKKEVYTSEKCFGIQNVHKDIDINVLIEIPSGTREKWELDKLDGKIKLEVIDSLPRIINYIGYPCNYGMVPKTLLPKEFGGDNDPLDVLVLGDPIKRGSIVKCKLIGVLNLIDGGEKDDKLIAVRTGTSFYKLNSLEDLESNYNGVLEILEIWFTNYKGLNKTKSLGYKGRNEAFKILNFGIYYYENQ